MESEDPIFTRTEQLMLFQVLLGHISQPAGTIAYLIVTYHDFFISFIRVFMVYCNRFHCTVSII